MILGCEESQEVTMAFRRKGHDAYSCDIQQCSGGYPLFHIQDDIFHELSRRMHVYDFAGMHPPCDFLANSGVRWLIRDNPTPGFVWNEELHKYYNPERWAQMEDGALFFKSLLSFVQSIGKGYLENPIIHKYALKIIGVKPTQIIQPWQCGHTESKATCLWLVGVPKLIPSNNVYEQMMKLPLKERTKIHYASPGINRKKIRSKTFPGIAQAMADQWG